MEFYHVLNRGINKQNVLNDDDDRMRFVRGLFIFNDRNPAPNAISQPTKRTVESASKRELLVDIHAWCLMDNHYHILLSPRNDDEANISLFMRKVNMGYAKFFNEKHERSGYLWQGKYKKVHIEHDNHFMYIPYYIHLNPLDKQYKEWREGALRDVDSALDFLDTYRWSSWLDYTGVKNFPSILRSDVMREILGSRTEQRRMARKIVNDVHLTQNASVIET